jgi:ABC-2 type transport system permease protein
VTVSTNVYARYEVLRTVRNLRFLIFSLAFPLVIFFVIAAPNRTVSIEGISLPLYFMVGMVSWGSMSSVLSGGTRIAAERAVGWNRQLRITPLRTRTYFGAKLLTGYLMALFSIATLFAAGVIMGVRLSAGDWLSLLGLLLVGLTPFAAMGVFLGHVLTAESAPPAVGGISAFFALFGGSWGPLATTGALHTFVQLLPSYWLVQAGKVALGGRAWPPEAWLVVAVWALAFGRLAMLAYRRDTHRQ